MAEIKKFSPGKWMGIVVFVQSLIILNGLIIGYIIQSIGGHELGIQTTQIVGFASTIFLMVWGSVFGSGLMKKYKELKNDQVHIDTNINNSD